MLHVRYSDPLNRNLRYEPVNHANHKDLESEFAKRLPAPDCVTRQRWLRGDRVEANWLKASSRAPIAYSTIEICRMPLLHNEANTTGMYPVIYTGTFINRYTGNFLID